MDNKLKEMIAYCVQSSVDRYRSLVHITPKHSADYEFYLSELEKGEKYILELKGKE